MAEPTTDQLKDRILRVLTAISTTGFTSSWIASSRRGFEVRESFRFDSTARMQQMTGDRETLVMDVETRRAAGGQPMKSSLPQPTDWSLHDLVQWIQSLSGAETDNLPAPQDRIEPVRRMREILDTIGTEDSVHIGFADYSAHLADDSGEYEPIVLVNRAPSLTDDKWGAENFLLMGR